MQEIAWFIAGAAAFALAHGVRTWLNSSPPRRGSRSGRQVVRPAPVPIVANGATKAAAPCENGDARALVKSVGDELATLASGVEGRAHLLIEAAPDRRALPAAAEGMLRAVQRLRTLHRKIVAFAIDRGAAPGRAELAQVVASRPEARAYRIELKGDRPKTTQLATRYLGSPDHVPLIDESPIPWASSPIEVA